MVSPVTTHNFMFQDVRAILVGFCLFSLVGFFPGYALGWLFDPLRFRARSLSFRLAMSVPLSIAIGPILSYLLGRWLSMKAVLVVYAILCVYGVFRATGELRGKFRLRPRLSRTELAVAGLVADWMVIAVLSLADMQIGARLYNSTIERHYHDGDSATVAVLFPRPPGCSALSLFLVDPVLPGTADCRSAGGCTAGFYRGHDVVRPGVD